MQIKYPLKTLPYKSEDISNGLILRGKADIGYPVVIEVVKSKNDYYIVTGDHIGVGIEFINNNTTSDYWDHEKVENSTMQKLFATIYKLLDFYKFEDGV